MKIAIGCDHGGLDLKNTVIAYLKEQGHEVQDFGCYDKTSCDYPDFGAPVGSAVAAGTADKGITICTTGIGIGIAASKIPGVTAVLCHNETDVRIAVERYHINVLSIGAAVTGTETALSMVREYLK